MEGFPVYSIFLGHLRYDSDDLPHATKFLVLVRANSQIKKSEKRVLMGHFDLYVEIEVSISTKAGNPKIFE